MVKSNLKERKAKDDDHPLALPYSSWDFCFLMNKKMEGEEKRHNKEYEISLVKTLKNS